MKKFSVLRFVVLILGAVVFMGIGSVLGRRDGLGPNVSVSTIETPPVIIATRPVASARSAALTQQAEKTEANPNAVAIANSIAQLRATHRSVNSYGHSLAVSAFQRQVKKWNSWDFYLMGVLHLQYDYDADARECFKQAAQFEPRLQPGIERVLREYETFGYAQNPFAPLFDVLNSR